MMPINPIPPDAPSALPPISETEKPKATRSTTLRVTDTKAASIRRGWRISDPSKIGMNLDATPKSNVVTNPSVNTCLTGSETSGGITSVTPAESSAETISITQPTASQP